MEGKDDLNTALKKVAKGQEFTIGALNRAYHRAKVKNKLETGKKHGHQRLADDQELGLVSFLVYCAFAPQLATPI